MKRIKYLALALAVVGASAHAITQREQQQAAQRAYQESAKSYEEARQGFERFKDGAERVRDTAAEVLRQLSRE